MEWVVRSWMGRVGGSELDGLSGWFGVGWVEWVVRSWMG